MDDWKSKIEKFGFGSDLDLDIPGVKKGFIPGTAYYDSHYGTFSWAYSTIYSLSIGEGENLITPLQMANLAADEAESKGYDVYVVFYDEENDDDAADFFEGLVRGSGQFRRTPNSDQLDEMMFDLCNSAKELQLVM